MNLFAQRRAIDEFHRDEMRAGLLANLVDVRDVGMIQGRGSLRLLNEAPHSILVGRHIRGQNFQRHPSPQLRILRQIHLAHSALANLGADFIAAEFCAGDKSHNWNVICHRSLSPQRRSRINTPAAMPRIAKPVVTVDEILMLSNGNSPVRISQSPSRSIPKFLPAKLLVSAMRSSFLNRPIELNNLISLQTHSSKSARP